MNIPYETMLSEFARVLKKYGFSPEKSTVKIPTSIFNEVGIKKFFTF